MTNLQKFGYASLASLVAVTQTFAAWNPDANGGAASTFDTESGRPLPEVIKSYISFILGFVTLIAVIYAVWAGWNIMTAGGDEEKVKKGRTTIIQITIGIIVMWLAYSVVSFIINAIGTAA
jgi:uncharacterized membrane protein YwzB